MSIEQPLLFGPEYNEIWAELQQQMPDNLRESPFIKSFFNARYLIAKGQKEEGLKIFSMLDESREYQRFEELHEDVLEKINEKMLNHFQKR